MLLRHHINHEVHRRWMNVYFRLFLKIKIQQVKIDKNEQIIVLSNHQTSLDSIIVDMAFNRNLYFLATDTLFSTFLIRVFIVHFFNPIPKKKGSSDLTAAKNMLKVINEGGSLCIFPEGNTSYGEFQFHMDKSLVRIIKKTKLTIVIENLNGGYGCKPRFAITRRKGPHTCTTKAILRYDDYKDMSDDELFDLIVNSLRVYDSESGNLYKSNRKAEYLERELFLCPKCNSVSSLYSKGNELKCHNCDLDYQYTEDLHLLDNQTNIKHKMVEFYNKQKDYIRDFKINDDEVIFKDNDVKLYELINNNTRRKFVFKGNMYITNKKFVFEGYKEFPIESIEVASPILGFKLGITIDGVDYFLKGNPRFNPLKYTLLFNRLDTKMKLNKNDKYYTLD